MATIKLSGDGQQFSLDDSIARSDERLKQALVPFYPEVANADIKRETRDGELVVTVLKRAGTKGSPLAELTAAPEEINPALLLAWELKLMETREELDLPALIALQPELDRAIEQGTADEQQVDTALKLLKAAKPMPSGHGWPGF